MKEMKSTHDTAILESAEKANRRWDRAFANTTEEQFDWLEQMFAKEEAKYGLLPLDFTEDE